MEEKARIVYNVDTNKIKAVYTEADGTVVGFNTPDTEGNERALVIGMCSAHYPVFVAQDYDVSVLEAYMNQNNIPIPS